MRGMRMNQMNPRPEWLQPSKRVSFTVKGVRPMLKETILKGWVAKCKIEGKNQTQLANELVENNIPEGKVTTHNVAFLITKYVKDQFKL